MEERDPEDLQVWLDQKTENIVGITPELLNPREYFVLKFLVTEYENFDVNTRIVGIKKISRLETIEFPRKQVLLIYFSSIMVLVLGFFIGMIIRMLSDPNYISISYKETLLAFALGCLLTILILRGCPRTHNLMKKASFIIIKLLLSCI